MMKLKDVNTLLEYEHAEYAKGARLIGGMDEVGRGPLAGPVTVACVIMPLDDLISGVDDSKKLSEKTREQLYPLIIQKALAYNVCSLDEKVIDSINILNATKQAMQKAVSGMSLTPDCVLVDAVELSLPVRTVSIIKGDAKSYNIACASIVAKVVRDRYMKQMDLLYPQYGFDRNKGYGTAEHIAALINEGACPIHRASFIKKFVK